jgi:geranylgeranyl diphosphate synthase, type II
VVEVIRLIAEAAGTLGMVGGQVDDIHFEGRPVDADTLRHIHARKTGALLNAAILSGAVLAGATEPELSALRRYGDHVGLAFQIIDDILDVTGDDEKLGKQTGSDEKKEKATYPRLFGIDGSTRLAREAADAAIAALDAAPSPMSQRAEPLRAFARYIVEREA